MRVFAYAGLLTSCLLCATSLAACGGPAAHGDSTTRSTISPAAETRGKLRAAKLHPCANRLNVGLNVAEHVIGETLPCEEIRHIVNAYLAHPDRTPTAWTRQSVPISGGGPNATVHEVQLRKPGNSPNKPGTMIFFTLYHSTNASPGGWRSAHKATAH